MLLTVEVTDPKYKVLRHEPTGAVFDEHGRSLWPADQFTHRLIAEGSVRVAEDKPAEASAVQEKPAADHAQPAAPAGKEI